MLRFKRLGSFLMLFLLSFFTVTILQAQDASSTITKQIEAVENALPMLYRSAAISKDVRATLADRMDFYHVPGVSIAVIHNYEVAWNKGYGTLATDVETPVDTETLFQAASISKTVSALGILRLVDSGQLDMDAPVNSYLQNWQVTDSSGKTQEQVTLRQLLSHTAGLTVSGFPGYAQDAELPTLEQILNGEEPANTPAVVVTTPPGTQYNYSGGGYTIANLLAEQITGQPFADYMQSLFDDLGLARSTYALLKPESDTNIAQAHLADGTTVPGAWDQYPESAAAGLWTTSEELARLFIVIAASTKGEAGAPLSAKLAQEMVTPILSNYGLGLAIESNGGVTWVTHSGSNLGYKSYAVIGLENGDGVVVLTNGDGGSDLEVEIAGAVAEVYHWPGFHQIPGQVILPMTADQLAGYEGQYSFLTFSADAYGHDGQLFVRLGEQFGNTIVPLYFISPTEVVGMAGSVRGSFKQDEQGRITGLQTTVPGLGKALLVRSIP